MKNKKSMLRIAYLTMVFGLAFSMNFGDFAMSADSLHDINTGEELSRIFTLTPYTKTHTATSNTGVTSEGIMSVVGSYNDDKTQYSTIDYRSNFYGFIVNDGITLNLSDIKIMGAS